MTKKFSLVAYLPMMVWLFFGILALHYGREVWNGGNGFKTGDWLINYSDGFIRRGLLGSVLYWFSGFGISLLWLTYVLQIFIYGLMFNFVLKLYNSTERSLFWLLILFSPAFLLFPFHDFGGGFRKEIIVLTLFAYFCLAYAKSSVSNFKIIWIIIIYTLAGLSHEITFFVLPFFLFLLWRCVETSQLEFKHAFRFSVVLILISFSLLILTYLFKGSEASASLICSSLVQRSLNPSICVGSVSWLSMDVSSSVRSVVKVVVERPYFLSVIQFVVLAFVPTIFTTFWNKRMLVLFFVSISFIAPLFITTLDWGRWIYILAFMFYCLLLSSKVTVNLPFHFSYLIFGLFYITTWNISHCCGGLGFGFINFPLMWCLKAII